MKRKTVLAAFLVAGVLLSWSSLSSWVSSPSPVSGSIDLQRALSDETGSFASVVPGRAFSFPGDHGAHPEFKTEWWYFTGNLEGPDGQIFGYQLTLFRIGLKSANNNPSAWSTDSIFMGHLALSDPKRQQFYHTERFARSALGLSGVKQNAEKIWLEDWTVERIEQPKASWKLRAETPTEAGLVFGLDLLLEDSKSPVLQGQSGYSRKGPEPEQASYYVSQTRLKTTGQIRIADQTLSVGGNSWFDHEWSSEAMAEGLAGWDWFSLQLEDQTELMLYVLRYEDGRIESASSGSLIDQSGQLRNLTLDDFSIQTNSTHLSRSGVSYPSQWTVSIPSIDLSVEVSPTMLDQEMTGSISYWEGAVAVSGTKNGAKIIGAGFVELTGY